MIGERIGKIVLRAYIAIVLGVVFAPIIVSFIYSFDANRYPTIPWGGFSTKWYAAALADPDVAKGLRNTIMVAIATAVISTLIGFVTAYTDYRYNFRGKAAYLGLAFLPPTIPVVILGLAMLMFLARTSLSGELYTVVICHVVYCIPFAMALIRLRLSQIDVNLEAAAWNLGAGEWSALREIILPHTLPSIFAALFLTAAVSFDEYAMAWFVSGFNETLPVRILVLLQREVSPKVNAIGSIVFIVSMTLIVLAQAALMLRRPGRGTRRSSAEGLP
jgi:spermidine/putrescine transport system permease protein